MSEKETDTAQEISKKELLQKTGISYGQLYRWKREGLIPEEWFEKRSAFTGQETFFPRNLVLDRVELIQSMKDTLSLSDIRDMLSTLPREADLLQALLATGSMSEELVNGLTIDLEGIWLSDLSIKAIATLCAAFDKAEVSIQDQSDLISRAIEVLQVEVHTLPGDTDTAAVQDNEPVAHQEDTSSTVNAIVVTAEADNTEADSSEPDNTEAAVDTIGATQAQAIEVEG